MEKTLRGKVLKMYEEDEDILEDAIIENRQAIEMSKTYSDILTSTMDAYSSIISNNLKKKSPCWKTSLSVQYVFLWYGIVALVKIKVNAPD